MKKKKRIICGIIISFAVILTAALTAGGICLNLVHQDHIQDQYTLKERDDSFLWDALKSSLLGSVYEASEAEVNTYLNDTFCGKDKFLRNVMVYFYKDAPCEIYAKIHYRDQDYALFSMADLTFDAEEGIVGVTFHDVKLGELPIPQNTVRSILSSFAQSHELVEFRDGLLYVTSRYEYRIKSVSFHLYLTEFSPQNGSIRCRTNSVSREILIAVKDYLLSADGREMLKRLFGSVTDGLKSLFSRFT